MKHIQSFDNFLNESKRTSDLWDVFQVVYNSGSPGDDAKTKKRKEWTDSQLNDKNNVLHKYIPKWSELDWNGQFTALKGLRGNAEKEVYEYLTKMFEDMKNIN
jgi:hypothetical protein